MSCQSSWIYTCDHCQAEIKEGADFIALRSDRMTGTGVAVNRARYGQIAGVGVDPVTYGQRVFLSSQEFCDWDCFLAYMKTIDKEPTSGEEKTETGDA